jgi:phosphoglycerate dehydrogenase-like enzyme
MFAATTLGPKVVPPGKHPSSQRKGSASDGGIGAATGRLMSSIGMRVHAINRRGRTDEQVDWIGTPDRLNELLEVADVLLISASLTRATYGLIGAAELAHMKDDAILVNLARGEIVQEKPLYDHLVGHPRFTAGIDAWWIEPVRHGEFRIDQPFLSLPNVIASPHNSAQSEGARDIGLRRAVENCRRVLTGETPLLRSAVHHQGRATRFGWSALWTMISDTSTRRRADSNRSKIPSKVLPMSPE